MMQGQQRRRSCWRSTFKFLEDAHMKNVVQTGAGWKGDAHRDLVDQLNDAVGPIEARSEPARRSLRKRRRAVPKPEQGPVAHLILHWTVAGVVIALLHRLRLFQPVADVVEELCALLHAAGNSGHPRLARLVRPDRRRIPAIDDTKRRVAK